MDDQRRCPRSIIDRNSMIANRNTIKLSKTNIHENDSKAKIERLDFDLEF
jgi:hypothetical protein